MKKPTQHRLRALAVAVLILGVMALIIVPQLRQKDVDTTENDALTHDITTVFDYQSDYVGDNSNTVNLFYHLPLNNVSMNFEIDGDSRTLTVNYQDTVTHIGTEKAHRDLIYNATAAMALIGNLDQIIFTFTDTYFIFDREELNIAYGAELSSLLNEKTWKTEVQDKLKDDAFINKFYLEELTVCE